MKGFNAKQFLIDHGEKIGFGVVALLVLFGLASTDWTPYDKEPEQIIEKVTQAEQTLQTTTWPEEEQELYVLSPEEQPENVVLAALSGDISVTPYMASQRMKKSIIDMDQPLVEPDFLPVEDLLATDARVYIELPPEETELAMADGEEGAEAVAEVEEESDEDLPDELRERRGGAGAGAGGLYDEYGGYGEEYEPDYLSMEAPELAMMDEYGYGEEYGYGYGEEGYEGLGSTGPTRRGRGYPFVSVRGVYPYKNQIYRYMEAMHTSYAEAVRHFELIDFELQRQELQSDGEWSDWETVDIDVLRDVINSASGIEPDVVSSAVTDSVITCPLPMRMTGMWRTQATHPRLENFELSDEEIEREMEMNRAMLAEVMEQQKDLQRSEVVPRGFSDLVFDSRRVQATLFDAETSYDAGMMTGMYGGDMYGEEMGYEMDYESEMGGGLYGRGSRAAGQSNPALDRVIRDLADQFEDEAEAREALEEWLRERATAEGELLLYRYLDFNVEPGRTYRYRVRLEVKNPNFNKSISAAGGVEHVVRGETRFTPWSEPTEPVTVGETVDYFLTRVDQRGGRLHPEAAMHVFQWDTEIGTVVHNQLMVEYGQEIGGRAQAVQIKPAEQAFEEATYVFTSDDRLVDSLPDLEFPASAHPDLQLPPGSRREARLVEHALVVQDDERLEVIDPVTQAAERQKQEKYVEVQEELYSEWRDRRRGPEAGEFVDGEYSDLYEDLYGEGMFGGYGEEEMMEGGPRRRSALRRGRGRRGGT